MSGPDHLNCLFWVVGINYCRSTFKCSCGISCSLEASKPNFSSSSFSGRNLFMSLGNLYNLLCTSAQQSTSHARMIVLAYLSRSFATTPSSKDKDGSASSYFLTSSAPFLLSHHSFSSTCFYISGQLPPNFLCFSLST